MTLNESIKTMTDEIVCVLAHNKPTIYLFGSAALDDFKLGWSDIDIVVLTEWEISEQHANTLVGLRQAMLERYPDNPYFRLFEGGIISLSAFLNGKNERTVYWGTSGQRLIDNYKLDSFGIAELLCKGILLYGDDVREKMTYPTYAQMRDDIARHIQTVREHGTAVGWLLDIARGIYTLRTGKVIAKTAAGEWALENGLCPNADAMQKAVAIRKEPTKYSREDRRIDSSVVQRFADVLDGEMKNRIMNRKKYIENDTLCLAEVVESDYKMLYDSWNDKDTVWGYNYKLPYTFDEYCQNAEKAETWGAVIMRREDGAIIGRIGLSAGLPDLTITIFKSYRSRNYGTQAFLLGVKYCFEILDLDKIYAGSYEDNIASRRMIERCGFKPNPDGNDTDPHIFTGEGRLQLDFVIENPRRAAK